MSRRIVGQDCPVAGGGRALGNVMAVTVGIVSVSCHSRVMVQADVVTQLVSKAVVASSTALLGGRHRKAMTDGIHVGNAAGAKAVDQDGCRIS